jgi:hypothetical protein
VHHTKTKGDLGVAKAFADIVAQGFLVLFPATEHAPFDLVAYDDGVFHRVQVKYRAVRRGGLYVRFRSVWSDRNGLHERPMDKSAVDVMCIYCPDTDSCYYIRPSDFRQGVTLRVVPTRNGQAIGVLAAEDCRQFPPRPRERQQPPGEPRGWGPPAALTYADPSHGGRSSGG